ncbi:hypothetical protein MOF42_20060, partial [Bacillus haynesii]|uniref:hypothetical protein n=1 Tax=Bacillus haynesii TaxID=1925021 RepID=UPI0022818B9B
PTAAKKPTQINSGMCASALNMNKHVKIMNNMAKNNRADMENDSRFSFDKSYTSLEEISLFNTLMLLRINVL